MKRRLTWLALLACLAGPGLAQEQHSEHEHDGHQHSFLQEYFLQAFWDQPFRQPGGARAAWLQGTLVLGLAFGIWAVDRRSRT